MDAQMRPYGKLTQMDPNRHSAHQFSPQHTRRARKRARQLNKKIIEENSMSGNFSISAKQIKSLRAEALEASDYSMVDLCDRALTDDHDILDQDGNEIPCAHLSQEQAREMCAECLVEKSSTLEKREEK